MQSSKIAPPVELGRQLRKHIRANQLKTGRSYRHLSQAIGKEGNYIASFLNKSPEVWAIPKHPAFGLLLKELRISVEELSEMAQADQAAFCGDGEPK